ncbi:DUF4268 domain-containing protein [Bacteroidota bacterium]
MELGKIEKIDIRSQWANEENHFTPWLAKEENIQLLADEISLDLEVEDTEVFIGSFKADILARDSEGRTVIIENQLEKTNHKHLGQIITYASGVGAKIMIWICSEVTDEHRQAINWLNDITSSDISFFAIEIELWKINESLPAPRFNIKAGPNDWTKSTKNSSEPRALTETRKSHLEFWNSFKEYMDINGTKLKMRTPRAQHWYGIAIGRSKFSISLTTNTQSGVVCCEIYIRGSKAKQAFSLLEKSKIDVEDILGELDWQELPDGQDCRIKKTTAGNTKDKSDWPEIHAWFKENSEKFYDVFSPLIKNLDI